MALTEIVNRRSQRSVPWWLMAIVVALVAGRVALRQFPESDKKSASLVRWVPAAQAVQIAKQRSRVIMYEFTAEWCPPCHQLEEQVFADSTLAARINRTVVPVRVMDRMREDGRNPPDVERLQNLYNVRGFPTVIFVDADGNLKQRMEGYSGRDAFEEQLIALAR